MNFWHSLTSSRVAIQTGGWGSSSPIWRTGPSPTSGAPKTSSFCKPPETICSNSPKGLPKLGLRRSLPKLRRKRLRVQLLARRKLRQVVPLEQRPLRKHLLLHELSHPRIAHIDRLPCVVSLQHVPRDRRVYLASEQLAQEIVVVIRRRRNHVNLARIVRRVPPLRPLQHLILLHQIQPQLVQVLRRIAIQLLFEPEHHLPPPREDQEPIPPHPRARRAIPRAILHLHAILLQPIRAFREPLEHHRHAFGRQNVRCGPDRKR